MPTDWEDPKAIQDLFQDEETWSREVAFKAPLYAWFAIVGHLQLALRYPENSGSSHPLVKSVAKAIAERLIQEIPAIDEGFIEKAEWHELGIEIKPKDKSPCSTRS